jgi:hypothetical protein
MLKVRIVASRDLQDNCTLEDKWSPTTSFCGLKMFLAHTCRLKVRVRQLDFIRAYLKQGAKAGSSLNSQYYYLKHFPNLLNTLADLYACSNPCTV